MPDTPEVRVAKVEQELRIRAPLIDKAVANLEEVRLNYVKREDLNSTKNEILGAIEKVGASLAEHQKASEAAHIALSKRVDVVELREAEAKGSINVIGWIAKTALGAAVAGLVGWVWKNISGA
jgi:hypothetical protein